MSDEVDTSVWFEEIEEAVESAPESVDRADGTGAQQALSLENADVGGVPPAKIKLKES
jgi:hypothetical protein